MTTSAQIAVALGKVCGMVQVAKRAKELVAIQNNTEMMIMSNDEIASNMAKDLFDVVKKYSTQMSASQIVGILEMHKQELIWHHFNEVKDEMIGEQK